MPVINVPTSFNINLQFDVPGMGRRLASLFIDMVVQFCYCVCISYLLNNIKSNFKTIDENNFNMWAIELILLLPVLLYHIILEVTNNGQSVGKKMMKLRVISTTGGRPGLGQLLIRWLLRISDTWIILLLFLLLYVLAGFGNSQAILIVIFGILFLMADIILVLISTKNQRIGDVLAQTIVIKTNLKESLDNTVFREVEDDYKPVFTGVMRISDSDLNAIKQLLDNSKKSHNYNMLVPAADKVKKYLNIETNMEPYEFLDRLLKDYNYLSSK